MTEQSDKEPAAKGETSEDPEVTAEINGAAENESAETTDGETTDGEATADEEAKEPEVSPEEQVVALNDKLLRAIAELENFRRRAERERQDTAKYAITGFARDCLTVLDNLRRGLDSVSAADRADCSSLETLAAGMELTERELISTLERYGIEKIDPLGELFDYDRHQTMFEIEDEKQPVGTVLQVAQTGYMLNDRLLRPAMVGIAKGGPKPGATEATAGDAGATAGDGDAGDGDAGDGDKDSK